MGLQAHQKWDSRPFNGGLGDRRPSGHRAIPWIYILSLSDQCYFLWMEDIWSKPGSSGSSPHLHWRSLRLASPTAHPSTHRFVFAALVTLHVDVDVQSSPETRLDASRSPCTPQIAGRTRGARTQRGDAATRPDEAVPHRRPRSAT